MKNDQFFARECARHYLMAGLHSFLHCFVGSLARDIFSRTYPLVIANYTPDPVALESPLSAQTRIIITPRALSSRSETIFPPKVSNAGNSFSDRAVSAIPPALIVRMMCQIRLRHPVNDGREMDPALPSIGWVCILVDGGSYALLRVWSGRHA